MLLVSDLDKKIQETSVKKGEKVGPAAAWALSTHKQFWSWGKENESPGPGGVLAHLTDFSASPLQGLSYHQSN